MNDTRKHVADHLRGRFQPSVSAITDKRIAEMYLRESNRELRSKIRTV